MTTSSDALTGRGAECARPLEALTLSRSGRSQVLVLSGKAGIGKTALLGFLAEHAAGIQSDMELAYAGPPAAVRSASRPHRRPPSSAT